MPLQPSLLVSSSTMSFNLAAAGHNSISEQRIAKRRAKMVGGMPPLLVHVMEDGEAVPRWVLLVPPHSMSLLLAGSIACTDPELTGGMGFLAFHLEAANAGLVPEIASHTPGR